MHTKATMVSVPVLTLSTLATTNSPAARAGGAGFFPAPSANIYCDLGTADSTTYAVCEKQAAITCTDNSSGRIRSEISFFPRDSYELH